MKTKIKTKPSKPSRRLEKLNLPSGAQYGYDSNGVRICVGSKMGRPSHTGARSVMCKLRLQRLPMNTGGYDKWGAYWGLPCNLWIATNRMEISDPGDLVEVFVRRESREAAKKIISLILPNARFYR